MGLRSIIHGWTTPKAAAVTTTGSFGWSGGAWPLDNIAAGENVNANTALTVSAVYASVRVLAETISTLPLKIYQTMPDGGKRLATEHPLNLPLRLRPNPYQDKVKFLDQGMTHLNLRGNMYAEIMSGPVNGAVDELMPIHPDDVKKVELLDNKRLRYVVRDGVGGERTINQDDMLHISGPLSQDGIFGMSPITAARQGIGLAMAAEKHGARVFGNGALPLINLIVPPNTKLSSEAIANMKQSWVNQNGGSNQLGVSVTYDGVEAKPMAMTSEDVQYIETRKFQVSDIARIYRVPPHLIGDLERATFSNIEEMGINFVEYSLVPWLTRIEMALMTQLMSTQDLQAGYFIEFIVEGLLRGDITSRYSAYQIGISNGFLSANEVRRLENLNPRDGGDEYLESQNTRPSGPISNGDTMAAILADEPEIVAEVEPSVFVADAAKRIAAAESREISKRSKHIQNDADGFDAWVNSYLPGDKHRKYVGLVVEPFGLGDETVDVICDPTDWYDRNDPADLRIEWKQNRADRIAAAITEGMTS